MMTPYPGTKVYEMVKRQGRFLINDWEDYVFFDQKARYEMGDMTAELVEEMYRKAYRQFYLRPFTRHAPAQDQGFLVQPAAQCAHCVQYLHPQEGKGRPAQADGSRRIDLGRHKIEERKTKIGRAIDSP
jgi:hypothetical protein